MILRENKTVSRLMKSNKRSDEFEHAMPYANGGDPHHKKLCNDDTLPKLMGSGTGMNKPVRPRPYTAGVLPM